MKKTLTLVLITLLISCGGKEENKTDISYEKSESSEIKKSPNTPPVSAIDLNNKGIGPVSKVTLNSEINQELANQGNDIFKKKCSVCHRPSKKFIGPAPKNILERRSPEWVMNFIINPELMLKEDPIAKALLIEYNGSPMPNQNTTEKEARALLEYFRTL